MLIDIIFINICIAIILMGIYFSLIWLSDICDLIRVHKKSKKNK